MEQLIELLQQIQDLAGVGIEALSEVVGGGPAGPEGEAPPAGPDGGPPPEGGEGVEGEPPAGPPPEEEPPA